MGAAARPSDSQDNKHDQMRRLTTVTALLLALVLLVGCAAGRAFRRGEDRARVGDWDTAVTYYRQAMQADPGNPNYRIALERAMLNASRVHFDSARQLEAKDQLDAALLEYRRTIEYDPGNTLAVDKVVQLEKIIRDRIEASRPKPAIVQLREQARQAGGAPLLNPASRVPFDYKFQQASLRDVLTFISNATGINVIYDASFQDRPVTMQLQGSVEQALNTLLSSNGLFYTILDERTIVVAQDTAQNRLKYERQVAIMLPLSYADATELAQMLTAITRTTTGVTIPPVIIPNKTNNTITVRATQPVIDVIRELVLSNDKPRAEVTIDVEILEVSRSRAKELGLNLTQNQIGGIFSPEQAPPGSAGVPPGTGDNVTTTDSRPFNVNTISQGVSTADFYLTVPQAIVKFLASDINTRFLAQTQLRGSEGAQLTLKVGADEPYLTTSFSPIAGGGANVNPLSSYTFRTVGISIQATPRLVTDEGDILMDLIMSNDTLGPPRAIGDQLAPSFPTRSITTKLRLRDGESHLLAGLLQDDERRSLQGFPGLISIPILRSLFSASDDRIAQTDVVMLLTPRIIRTHEYTARDLSPIYLGTNQNFGLTGPPPLIAAPPADTAPPPGPATAPPAQGVPPQGIPVPSVPQAGNPGLVTTPVPQAPPATGPLAPPAADAQAQRDLTAPQTTSLAPMAQVSVTPPAGDVRAGAGPYLIPVYVSGISGASTVTVTLTFNPSILRVRTVQEGSFLRQGAVNVVFTPNTDPATGRVDLTFVRTGDAVGASGSGLLAALQFDAVAAGSSPLTISGVATNPTGGTIPLQFVPGSVVVR
jgi:general secretion pathway protein D